jgi:bifunctional ADP-heptose synthase (sugar kinase/adenylyltransferase)
VARNCAALGARTQLLSVIGRDEAGETLARLVAQSGVKANLHRDASIPTTVKLRVIGRQQQLLRIDSNGAVARSAATKLAEFERLWIRPLVLPSDYGAVSPTSHHDRARESAWTDRRRSQG